VDRASRRPGRSRPAADVSFLAAYAKPNTQTRNKYSHGRGAILPDSLSIWYFFFYRQNAIIAMTGEPPAETT
jgi:hypothetical protein